MQAGWPASYLSSMLCSYVYCFWISLRSAETFATSLHDQQTTIIVSKHEGWYRMLLLCMCGLIFPIEWCHLVLVFSLHMFVSAE